MTIAIGILAQGGLVVGADSEESTGYLKSNQHKLLTVYNGVPVGPPPYPAVCIFTGAGDSGYVEALIEKLSTVFYDDALPEHALKQALSQRLKEFYKDHVIPFAAFPENNRPAVELLMAVNRKQHPRLLVTERTTIRSASPYGTIGIGSTVAKIVLDALWRPASLDEIGALAVYVLSVVKEQVEGCGKRSSVMAIDTSQATASMSAERILELEALFAGKFAREQKNAFWNFVSTNVSSQSVLQMSTDQS
jgi:20S proteasome alpha/beta subunit